MAAGWCRKFAAVAIGFIFLCKACTGRYGSLTCPTDSGFLDNISADPCGWKWPAAATAAPVAPPLAAVAGNGLKLPPAADRPTSGADVAGVVIFRRSGECVGISVAG